MNRCLLAVFLGGAAGTVAATLENAADPTAAATVLPAENGAIRTALATKLAVDFNNKPLQEAIADLAARLRISVWINDAALGAAMVAADRPVTVALKDASAETIFRQLLFPLNLAAVPRDEYLEIAEVSTYYSEMSSRVYPIADLAWIPLAGGWTKATAQIVRILDRMACDNNGNCFRDFNVVEADPLGAVLIVTADHRAHGKVAELLNSLRESKRHTEALLKTAGMPPLETLLRAEPVPPPEWVRELLKTHPAVTLAAAAHDGEAPAAAKEARALAEKALKLALKLEADALARNAAKK